MTKIDTEELFDEFLDEVYGTFLIGELQFFASDILKSCDPIAYRVGLSDYESMMEEEDEEND